ncbi:MAG: hypothetical protein GY822_19130 [Deltaproteobacteria bacterium]|nr:hypothetical protein [Deltaproteobacteria bacterium]
MTCFSLAKSAFALSFLGATLLLPSLALASDAPLEVQKVAWTQNGEQGVLRIDVDRPPTFEATAQGALVVVDLVNAKAKPEVLASKSTLVRAVTVEALVSEKRQGTRVKLLLRKSVTYDVTAKGKSVYITLSTVSRKGTPTASLAGVRTQPSSVQKVARLQGKKRNVATDVRLAQADSADDGDEGDDEDDGEEEGSAGASTDDGSETASKNRMTYIGFRNTSEGSTLFARMNNKNASYEVKREGQNLLVLEITDASIPLRNNKNYLDTTHFSSPVKMITPTEIDDETPKIRIIIELKENVPYQDSRDGVDIVVTFKK